MRRRRAILAGLLSVGAVMAVVLSFANMTIEQITLRQIETSDVEVVDDEDLAINVLEELPVKGRAPKTGYSRDEFGGDWAKVLGCSTRHIILNRDMRDVEVDEDCKVTGGVLDDPYTGEEVHYTSSNPSAVQIDHVIALSDAWQKGAQQLSREERTKLANDPLELLAVDGPANQQKSDSDAASWLPSNKSFRCEYVARQIAIKKKYRLWVTEAEKETMVRVLGGCPGERVLTSAV